MKTLVNPYGLVWFPTETISHSLSSAFISKHTLIVKTSNTFSTTIKIKDAEIQISASTNSLLISLSLFSSSFFLCSTKLRSTQWRRRRFPKPGHFSHPHLHHHYCFCYVIFYFDFDLKLMILLFGLRFWLKEERNRVLPFSTGQRLWTRLLLQWYGFFPFLLHLLRVLSYGALKQTQTPDTHWRWCCRGWV